MAVPFIVDRGRWGSISLMVYRYVSLSPATAPPHFYTWGGKPYPYVLTLKGKPLGRNPNRVNPYVVTLLLAHTVVLNENDSHSHLVSLAQWGNVDRGLKGFSMLFCVYAYQCSYLVSIPCLSYVFTLSIP